MSRPKQRKGGRVTPKGTGSNKGAGSDMAAGSNTGATIAGGPGGLRSLPSLDLGSGPFGSAADGIDDPFGGALSGPLGSTWDDEYDEDDPDVLSLAGDAIASGHPAELMVLASTFAEAVADAGRSRPLIAEVNPDDPDAEISWDVIVEDFVNVTRPETTALLYALVPLAPPEVGAVLVAELAKRSTPGLPEWIASIGDAEVADVWVRSAVLGDDDDWFLGVKWPTGQQLTFVVHTDHHAGGMVQDVFLAPMPFEQMHQILTGDGEGTVDQHPVDPADARMVLERAVQRWEMTYPPSLTDDWPIMRPLLLWLLSTLPEGGADPERAFVDDDTRNELIASFLSSSFSEPVRNDADAGLLVESILWYGCDYGVGDPLRWSDLRVELLMLDFFPRKVVVEEAFLAKLPAVLAAFVAFAMSRLGECEGLSPELVGELTAQVVEVIEEITPEYLELIAGGDDELGEFGDFDPDELTNLGDIGLAGTGDEVGPKTVPRSEE